MSHKRALIDTNILVIGSGARGTSEQQEKAFLLLQDHSIFITSRTLVEYVNVISTTLVEKPYSKSEAKQSVEALQKTLSRRILIEKNKTLVRALDLFFSSKKSKKWFIFDCMIAATALDHRIHTIYTENTEDFEAFPTITAINPFS